MYSQSPQRSATVLLRSASTPAAIARGARGDPGLALGADPSSVIRMIVAGGMRWAVIGCAVGLVLVVIEARWLSAVLFEVGAMDPLTIAFTALVLLGVAAFASWIPGLRAARIHPIEAISTD